MMTMKDTVFWDVTPCGDIDANVVPVSLIFPALMMMIHFFETSILTKATRRHIPE
jgi:hypothetical protein